MTIDRSTINKWPSIGYDDFSSIISSNGYFVDKTLFIKELFKYAHSQVLLITRPRRFGKSVIMSMFASFLQLNYSNPQDLTDHLKLFEDTKIIEDREFCQEFMGQYPAIFISFKDIDGANFSSAYYKLGTVISDLYEKFDFLLESKSLSAKDRNYIQYMIDLEQDPNDLKQQNEITLSLLNLCKFLYKHFKKKVILFIDEYDVPMAKATTKGYYDEVIDIMRTLYSKALKSNFYLHKAILTGCLRVSKESIFTGLNNLAVNSVLSDSKRLSDIIGFTKEETYEMLNYFNLLEYSELIKEWYDGYNFNNHEIFNAWDVVNFIDYLLNKDENDSVVPKNFWINTSSNEIINEFLGYLTESDAVNMQDLLDGKTIYKKIKDEVTYQDLKLHRSDDFWSMLLYTGYLTIAKNSNFDYLNSEMPLKIPNLSIRQCFQTKIKDFFSYDPTEKQKANEVLTAILDYDQEKVRIAINNALKKYVSFRDFSSKYAKEYYYHAFLNGIFSTQSAFISNYQTNAEAGNGYLDISFTAKDETVGVIIEIKYSPEVSIMKQLAQEGLDQIEEKNYPLIFNDDSINKIMLYGISFCKKTCKVASKIIEPKQLN